MQDNLSEAHISSEVERLNQSINDLSQELKRIQQEKDDLEILLETVTTHSDVTLEGIRKEKSDLEIILETTTEHSDTLTLELKLQAEEERRQREEQFQLITEATPVAVLVSRIADAQILYANEMAGLMLDMPHSELLNYQTVDFYQNLSDRQRILETLQQEQRFQGEVQLKRPDGKLFWALLTLRPFKFQGEDVFLTAVYNITDRKQAEEALKIAEAKYRGIFENAVEGIYQSTQAGRYLEVNPAMAAMFGYASPMDMVQDIQQIDVQVYVESDRWQEFMQAVNQQGEIKDFEYQAYRRDGSIIWVSEWARSVNDTSGKLPYYEGSCIDITRRKQEEESLKRQVLALQIEIDQTKCEWEVAKITQSDYFQQLMREVEELRKHNSEES
jgi:PAS domain S-box-containing protein